MSTTKVSALSAKTNTSGAEELLINDIIKFAKIIS